MKYQFSRCEKSTLINVPVTDGQLVYVKDTGDTYFDVGENRVKVTDIIFIDTENDRNTMTNPLEYKLYYVYESNCLYTYKGNEWTNVKISVKAEDVQFVSEGTELVSTTVQDVILEVYGKRGVEPTSEINQIYGTDENGNQLTYDIDIIQNIDDIQVDGVSILQDKVANIDLQSTVDSINTQIEEVQTNVDTVQENLDTAVDTINTDISNLEETLNQTIQDNVDNITTDIETDVQTLEQSIADVDGKVDQYIQDNDTALADLDTTKLDKVTQTDILYGTDSTGNQTSILKTDLISVEDIQVNGVSILTDKVANIDLQSITNQIESNKTEADTSITNLQNNKLDKSFANSLNNEIVGGVTFSPDSEVNGTHINVKTINPADGSLKSYDSYIYSENQDVKFAGKERGIDLTIPKLDTINTSITNLDAKLTKQIEDNTSDINTQISDLNTKIETNTNNIQTNKDSIQTNTQSITNNTQAITSLEQTVTTHTGQISTLTTATETIRVTSSANTTAIAGLRNEIDTYHHYFRGYFEHNSDIESLEAQRGDYAYSGETNTIWSFDTVWSDTLDPIPSDMGGKTQTTPLMDGEASVGSEQYYAAGDHVHPTDVTRASQIDFVAHTSNKENPHEVTKTQVGLGNVDNTSDVDKPISTATQEALQLKQDITSTALNTTDKTLVGAINELLVKINTLQQQVDNLSNN